MLWKMILIERATLPLVIELFLASFKATVASVEIDLHVKQWARMTPEPIFHLAATGNFEGFLLANNLNAWRE